MTPLFAVNPAPIELSKSKDNSLPFLTNPVPASVIINDSDPDRPTAHKSNDSFHNMEAAVLDPLSTSIPASIPYPDVNPELSVI
jgi:hypothetical protein